MYPKNAWYVACTPDEIADKPLGRTICGEKIVFYRPAPDQVAALDDFCPHRGAPLSLGTVCEGHLQCGYHGLRVECTGKSVSMPGQRVQGFPKAKSFPVVERYGFIWVWPGDADKADPATIHHLPWANNPEWAYGGGLYHTACDYSLMIDNRTTLAAKAPGTVIIVIGESASRNYMKAYTPDFPYEDTPWLSQKLASQDPGFLKFDNVYSSWSQTVPVLQRALTEQSQYNGKEFFDSASIVDVAKKSGYETWWFSNQGRYGQYDSAITLVAKTADHADWTDDSYNFSDKYDESLMQYLTQLDPTKNNFVVLHIMGSHIYYNNRYPEQFNQFKTEDGESTVSSMPSYANSILYTDYVMSQVFDYAQKNLNLQAMVYFSDHGENLEISHNPDVFSFDMVRIPMWIYLSPAYQQALPGHTRAMRQHQTRYFTNDMLYDTICGLLNAPSSRYNPEQDFASPTYGFTRQDLTTMLGQHRLTEDPDGLPETPPQP